MRILNRSSDDPISDLSLYLTIDEAKQMAGYLEDLISGDIHHAHINDDSYEREITISIYSSSNINSFDERSKRLITEGT